MKRVSQLPTYIETPEFYGESGKLSYTWVLYNHTAELVLSGDSKEVEDLFQNNTNPNIYYVIGRDYSMTNCTGVFASEITLGDNGMEFNNDVITLNSNDNYSKQSGVLYGQSQLAIQKGNTEGTQLIVKEVNDDSSLELNLNEDNCFAG